MLLPRAHQLTVHLIGLVRQGTFTLDQKFYIYRDIFTSRCQYTYMDMCFIEQILFLLNLFSMTQYLIDTVHDTLIQESDRLSIWINLQMGCPGPFITQTSEVLVIFSTSNRLNSRPVITFIIFQIRLNPRYRNAVNYSYIQYIYIFIAKLMDVYKVCINIW